MPLRAWHSALKVICLGVRNELGSAFISAWVPPQCLLKKKNKKKTVYLWVENTLWKRRTVFCLWVILPSPFSVTFHVKELVPVFDKHKDSLLIQILSERYRSLTLVWNAINGRQNERKRQRRASVSGSLCPLLIGLHLKHLWLWENVSHENFTFFFQHDCLWC